MASNDSIDEIKCNQSNEVIPTMNDSDSDEDEDNGAWSFESDHAALKNNSDYVKLLRTLTILQAQRIQTDKDLSTVRELKRMVTEDPVKFVEQMQSGDDLAFPLPVKMAAIPHIDWDSYKAGPSRHTRLLARSNTHDSHSTMPEARGGATDGGVTGSVRGRATDDSKSTSFNQLWSAEEQGRLEELLAEFPPESIELLRHRKIATGLGNRTARQVSSRIQRYFVKLHQAGLPVPGRPTPAVVRQQRRQHLPMRCPPPPLSLRPQYTPAPTRVDSEEDGDKGDGDKGDSDDSEDETMGIAGKVAEARVAQLLSLLQRVFAERQRDRAAVRPVHFDFKCDVCQDEPIVGTRWHCVTCVDISYDCCDDCVITQAESSSPHPLSHCLEAVTNVAALDSAYQENEDMR